MISCAATPMMFEPLPEAWHHPHLPTLLHAHRLSTCSPPPPAAAAANTTYSKNSSDPHASSCSFDISSLIISSGLSASLFSPPPQHLLLPQHPLQPDLSFHLAQLKVAPSSSAPHHDNHTSAAAPQAVAGLFKGNLLLALDSCLPSPTPCVHHEWMITSRLPHVNSPSYNWFSSSSTQMTVAVEGLLLPLSTTPQGTHVHAELSMVGCALRPLPNSSFRQGLRVGRRCSYWHGCLHIIETAFLEPPSTVLDCNISVRLQNVSNPTLTSYTAQAHVSSSRAQDDPLFFDTFFFPALSFAHPDSYKHTTALNVDAQDTQTPTDAAIRMAHPLSCSVLVSLLDGLQLRMMPQNRSQLFRDWIAFGPFVSPLPGASVSNKARFKNVGCQDAGSHLRVSLLIAADVMVLSKDGRRHEHDIPFNHALTLSAEGTANKSSGELNMVACSQKKASVSSQVLGARSDVLCNIRVLLHLTNPVLTITRRGVIAGRIISNSDSDTATPFPTLTLQTDWTERSVRWKFLDPPPDTSYNYTRLDDLLKRIPISQSPNSITSENPCNSSVWWLSFDAMLSPLRRSDVYWRFFALDVIAVDNCVLPRAMNDYQAVPGDYFVRIAVQIVLDDDHIPAEGLYDPSSRTMYLLGCTAGGGPFKTATMPVESDILDCSLLINVQFPASEPPKWFQRRKWEVRFETTRGKSENLYFEPLRFEAYFDGIVEETEYRISLKKMECLTTVVVTSLILGCTLSQVFYGWRHPELVPFVSLASVALQAIGLCIPAILRTMLVSLGLTTPSALLGPTKRVMADCKLRTNSLRAMASATLLWLFCNILKSRKNTVPVVPNKAKPKSFRELECRVIHLCAPFFVGLLAILVSLAVYDASSPGDLWMQPRFWYLYAVKSSRWMFDLRDYAGVLQELFLLPQCIQNGVWNVQGRPLSPLYYEGIPAVQLLLHLYNFLYWEYMHDVSWWDSHYFALECFLISIGSVLALTIHVQQKYGGRLEGLIRRGAVFV